MMVDVTKGVVMAVMGTSRDVFIFVQERYDIVVRYGLVEDEAVGLLPSGKLLRVTGKKGGAHGCKASH